MARAISAKLVEELTKLGLDAELSQAVSPPFEGNVVLIKGQILSIDEGNRTERNMIGLGPALRQHHLDGESRDVVKAGMGLVATMAALVLGLLVASAKSAYDAQKDGLDEMAANLTLLDNILEQYGPPAEDAREILRGTVAAAVARLWPADASQVATLGVAQTTAGGRSFYARILELSPTNATQSGLHSQALQLAAGLAHERLLLIAHRESGAVSGAFLVILSFWLVVLFASFGLFAPRNALVITALLTSALSVSGAIFLTLELAQPFGGLSLRPQCREQPSLGRRDRDRGNALSPRDAIAGIVFVARPWKRAPTPSGGTRPVLAPTR